MASCSCEEWEEWAPQLDAGASIMIARGYDFHWKGPIFRFCPWCGAKLKEEAKNEQ